MRLVLFEDGCAEDFNPLTLMRPTFELTCGQFSLRERFARRGLLEDWGVLVRAYLAETYSQRHETARVNDLVWLQEQPTRFINGRWLANAQAFEETISQLDANHVAVIEGRVVAIDLVPEEIAIINEGEWEDGIATVARTREAFGASGCLLHRPWDVVAQNASQIDADFSEFSSPGKLGDLGRDVKILGNADDVCIHPSAEIDPYVVIDVRRGPVSIGASAMIQSFSRIEGPCHIGEEAQVFRAQIRGGCTIGPRSRVGGELEASILQSDVNKYHDGFFGHGYACPWVNFGAISTNSDLKNDYSPIRVPVGGELIDSEQTKVGLFIGDHAKTAIGTLFNTGSSVGVMAIVLPGGELLPKEVPSFARVWHGDLTDGWELDRLIDTARIVCSRRGVDFTPAEERLIRYLAKHTQTHRGRAIQAHQQRREQQHEQREMIYWK